MCGKIMFHAIKGRKLVILLPRWLCIKCQERYFISWVVLFRCHLGLVVLSELNNIIKSKWASGPSEAWC